MADQTEPTQAPSAEQTRSGASVDRRGLRVWTAAEREKIKRLAATAPRFDLADASA